MKPLVTIVVLTHNRAGMLGNTLRTVLDQRYRPVEVLVVDDGSTDATPSVVAGFGDAVRYHHQDSQGIARARTRAALLARGDWLAFHDDDDPMHPDRLDRLVDAASSQPDSKLVAGDIQVIEPDGRPVRMRRFDGVPTGGAPQVVPDAYDQILGGALPALPHSTLVRRDLGAEVGWFDARFVRTCEDLDFYARCAKRTRFVYVPQTVSLWVRSPDHASLSQRSLQLQYGVLMLLEKHLGAPDGPSGPPRDAARSRLYTMVRSLDAYRLEGAAMEPTVDPQVVVRARRLLRRRDRLRARLHPVELRALHALAAVGLRSRTEH